MKTRTRFTLFNQLHNWSAARAIGWFVAWSAALAMPVPAATNVVTSSADNGPGSLRQIIAEAAAGDTLMFGVTGTITLTSGELVLVKNLNIIGPGAANLAISGNHSSRLLTVQSNVVASLSGLTLRDGKASNGDAGTVVEGHATPGGPGQPGGAIYTMGTLTLNDCRVISNTAGHGGYGIGSDLIGVSAGGNGGSGGGVYNAGTMFVNNCVVSGNSAGNGGASGDGWTYSPISGAGGEGGGIYNVGTLWLDNSVVSSNVAGGGGDTPREARGGHGGAGGGILNSGVFTAVGSTVYGNASGNGGHGGVDSLDGGDGGNGGNGGGVFSSGGLALTNCTVSGNFCGRGGDGGLGVLGDSGSGGSGGSGGGIYLVGESIVLVNCGIFGNHPGQAGGGPGAAGANGSVGPYESSQTLVTSCTEAALRAGLAGPQPVTFACDGTITLSDTIVIANSTVLDGGGHRVIISGNNAVRVFHVQTNVVFTLANLTITQGRHSHGGGIYNEGGTVTLLGVTLADNVATNHLGDACGGAVFNLGTLSATDCTFAQNAVVGGPGSNARAFYVPDPPNDIPDPVPPTGGRSAKGGAVYSTGSFTAVHSSFVQNLASGGVGGRGLCFVEGYCGPSYSFNGASGGRAEGGAIFSAGEAEVEQCLVVSNRVTGGPGGAGGGGAGNDLCGLVTQGSDGGIGGNAVGAAFMNCGPVNWLNCTLAWNRSMGGAGGTGGSGVAFACHGPGQTVGGRGGNGGAAGGAGWDEDSGLSLINCTIAENAGFGGAGGATGGGGYHLLYLPEPPGSVLIVQPAPPDGLPGNGVGGLAGAGRLFNTLVASNHPVNGQGLFTDSGHNLSSDDSCAFTNATSLNNTDPKLGPLADNGGPTLTMALLPGSPAIDAGDPTSATPTDQRGVPRPYGQTADIGAFEYWLQAQAVACPIEGIDILALGIAGQSCRLLVSPDLTTWTATATNQIGADGTTLFHDDGNEQSQRFYRLMLQ